MFNEKEKNSARKLIIKCFFYVVDFETIFIDIDVIITECYSTSDVLKNKN